MAKGKSRKTEKEKQAQRARTRWNKIHKIEEQLAIAGTEDEKKKLVESLEKWKNKTK